MGYEYRLHVEPPGFDLDAVCDSVFARTDWQRIDTSFVELSGIGVQYGEVPTDPSWPHVADLHLEDDGVIFIICHNQNGGQFMRALVEYLRDVEFAVTIDDDI